MASCSSAWAAIQETHNTCPFPPTLKPFRANVIHWRPTLVARLVWSVSSHRFGLILRIPNTPPTFFTLTLSRRLVAWGVLNDYVSSQIFLVLRSRTSSGFSARHHPHDTYIGRHFDLRRAIFHNLVNLSEKAFSLRCLSEGLLLHHDPSTMCTTTRSYLVADCKVAQLLKAALFSDWYCLSWTKTDTITGLSDAILYTIPDWETTSIYSSPIIIK